MAQIIIEIPDENVVLVADAVRAHTNTPGMTDGEAATWVDAWLTGRLKLFVRRYQEQAHLDTFTFNDPMP
jgi:hypothetical protein